MDYPAVLPRLLTTEQASQYLAIPAATLTTWRCHQKGPSFVRVRANGRINPRNVVRYPIESLNEWIAANLEGVKS